MDRIRRFDSNLIAVCGGALSAGLALFPLNFYVISFLLTYFAAFPLYFIGLSWGVARLVLAILVAFSIFTISSGMHAGFTFILTTLLPVLLIVYRFHKGDPAGYIVSWVTGLSLVIFLGIILILSSQSVNIVELLHSWFVLFANEASLKNMHGQIISYLPGISSISWTIMCLVNASLAQRLAVRIALSSRPYPLPTDGQLYESWDLIFTIGLLLTLTGIPLFAFIGKNMALISCAPLFLVGLTTVYAWLEQFDNPKSWIIGIVFISIFLVWPGILIVILGFLEPTLHLRQRWALTKS